MGNAITIVFIGSILIAFIFHFIKKQDLKPIMVTLGVLGTFVGIFIGLWDFDTSDISGSIPPLLDGLKIAFLTSIIGMFVSMVTSIIEKVFREDEIESISENQLLLEELRSIKLTVKDSIQFQINRLLIDGFDKIPQIMQKFHEGQNQKFSNMITEIRILLQTALKKISEGASKEIISALETVIQDFNQNLTAQFGDNFKQLNESVKKLLVWQDNYKEHVENTNNILKSIFNDFESVVSDFRGIKHIHENLDSLLKRNNEYLTEFEIHLQSIKILGDDAGSVVSHLKYFSTEIQESLSTQSKVVTQLTREIEQQLPDSLGELNRALTSLTAKFKDDYESFLQHMRKITRLN